VIEVDCYAGYRGEQTPRTLRLDDRCIEVDQVVDQWLAPGHRYFKVRGDDGHIYIIRHDGQSGEWELTLFQRSEREGSGYARLSPNTTTVTVRLKAQWRGAHGARLRSLAPQDVKSQQGRTSRLTVRPRPNLLMSQHPGPSVPVS
jgi:hypothetical protein